ncbi:MAG: exodeoxyribonuclease VII small subunit [Gemmatimonadota bacterium]
MATDGSPDFESALAELERIVRRLDGNELDLEEALSLFEAGMGHLRAATRLLVEARGAVEELIETASGDLKAIGFEPPHEETGENGS